MKQLLENTKPIVAPAAKARPYFGALTGIRAVAAYMVFFHHFNPFKDDSSTGRYLQKLFLQFHIGVTIFFVLSGLLICVRYLNKVELSGRWALRYMRNRIARIYPLYLSLTLFTYAVFEVNPRMDILGAWPNYTVKDKLLTSFLNFTMLRGLFADYKFTGIPQGWSLTVEECFYVSAPFLLLGLAFRRGLLWLYAPGLVAIGMLLVRICAPIHTGGFFGSYTFLFNYTFFGRCAEFLIGMALGLLVTRTAKTAKPAWHWTGAGVAGVGMCLLALMVLDSPVEMASGITNPYSIAVNNLALPIGVAMLFYGLIFELSFLRRLLESKLFDELGKSSYAFYLAHMGVFSMAINTFSSSLALKFVLLNTIAYALYKGIEKPMHKLLTSRRVARY